MSRTDGLLVPSDEGMNHQITETFASIQQSDRSWAEKVCASIAAKDGSLQIGFGLGKYINRNVMDVYAGISRGKEQRTVRASRRLVPTPDLSSVGPIHYEVLEPLNKIRFCLEENETQPFSFDVVFDGSAIPPFLENHEFRRQLGGFRVDTDLVRYHQVGVPRGWLKVDGQEVEITPEEWFSTRDHSWGLRYGVGIDPTDLAPGIDSAQFPMNFLWSPMRFQRADGSSYSIHHYYMKVNIPGVPKTFYGGIEHADGSREAFVDLEPALRYDPKNRRLLGGSLHFVLESGEQREVQVEVVSDTGFHLGTGLYFGFEGHHHGEWRGEYHQEGERLEDCAEVETARRIHQIRDCVVRVRDGENLGYANYQTIVNGAWPELGLDQESSFL